MALVPVQWIYIDNRKYVNRQDDVRHVTFVYSYPVISFSFKFGTPIDYGLSIVSMINYPIKEHHQVHVIVFCVNYG